MTLHKFRHLYIHCNLSNMCQHVYKAVRRDVEMTQASQGTVVNAGERGAIIPATSGGRGVVQRRHARGPTQTSEGGVSNVPSPPPSSSAPRDSPRSHGPTQSKGPVRPIVIPKNLGSTSSSPTTVTLPMFLEKGDTAALVDQSTKDGGWVDAIQAMVEHIKKVFASLPMDCFILKLLYNVSILF